MQEKSTFHTNKARVIMRTWFLGRQYFHLLLYLFIFKVSFCGKKSSQSNKERWESAEWKFYFFRHPHPPQYRELEKRGRGHLRSSHHFRGSRNPERPGRCAPLELRDPVDPSTHMSPLGTAPSPPACSDQHPAGFSASTPGEWEKGAPPAPRPG